MLFKMIDFLSPKVTLYYNGYLSHSSIISIILSIISIIFILILSIYFLSDLIFRKNPYSSYFNIFNEDVGVFKINKSSLFHFVNILQINRGVQINEEFDFTIYNIIGSKLYTDGFLMRESQYGLHTLEHWIYGFCNKNINTEGLDDLLTYDFFEKSACIKKYYNSSEGKYYDIGHPKFKWPEIAHGTFNELNKLYGIYVQKCNNKTIKNILGNDYNCKSDSEIDKYFNFGYPRLFNFYFINNYINVLDYKNPNKKFFYRIETPFSHNQYTQNNLNFNPVTIRSHNNLLKDAAKDEVSYIYDRNDVYTESNQGKNIYIEYFFFLKNIINYYERSYKKIPDILSSLGGICQTIYIIAFYLNYLINKYIVLSDTKILLDSFLHKEEKLFQFRNLNNIVKEIVKHKKNDEYKNNSKIKLSDANDNQNILVI